MISCLKALLRQHCCDKKGQASAEYVLMLSSIVVVLSAFMMAFHKDIVRWFFIFIGEMLTPNG